MSVINIGFNLKSLEDILGRQKKREKKREKIISLDIVIKCEKYY